MPTDSTEPTPTRPLANRVDAGGEEQTTESLIRSNLKRLLELELNKVRQQASLLKLEMRAADIERQMQAIPNLILAADPKSESLRPQNLCDSRTSAANPNPHFKTPQPPRSSPTNFQSWADVRRAQQRSRQTHKPVQPYPREPNPHEPDPHEPDPCEQPQPAGLSPAAKVDQMSAAHPKNGFQRFDPPHRTVRRPLSDDGVSNNETKPARPTRTGADLIDPAATKSNVDDVPGLTPASKSGRQPKTLPAAAPEPNSESVDGPDLYSKVITEADLVSPRIEPIAISEDLFNADKSPQRRRRRSPLVLAVSTAIHVLLLAALALIGLKTHDPKDQVSLTASAAEPSREPMESFTIEQIEPVEPTPVSETAEAIDYDLNKIGTMPPPRLSVDTASLTNPLVSMSAMSAAQSLSDLANPSDSKIQFCGVEGGGNHFVYLVDSSNSMGDGFESARAELLQSIDALRPGQRFYVVFFDSQSDYMRVTDPGKDETASVKATPANKAALRRWAMTVTKDRGKAPYEAIPFALKLRPDVVFLLSDGEFPQRIEDILKQENRISNLFGDDKPIAIVHTIAYFSRDGEARMQRIAKQNAGQYRYIAKPGE